MNKQTLMLSVMAKTLYLGWGDRETALSLERSVFLPIIHDKYLMGTIGEDGYLLWFSSYVYISEQRLEELQSFEEPLNDEDYLNSTGDVFYTPYAVGESFPKTLKSDLIRLAEAGKCKYMARHKANKNPEKPPRLAKIKLRVEI